MRLLIRFTYHSKFTISIGSDKPILNNMPAVFKKSLPLSKT
jgi:hypothetical protein